MGDIYLIIYSYNNGLIIGGEAQSNNFPASKNRFLVTIYELMIFDRGLTEEEIMLLYNMYNY